MTKKELIKEIERRIDDWESDKEKNIQGKFQNYLHSKQIDSSIDDIVIQELKELLKFALGENDE